MPAGGPATVRMTSFGIATRLVVMLPVYAGGSGANPRFPLNVPPHVNTVHFTIPLYRSSRR